MGHTSSINANEGVEGVRSLGLTLKKMDLEANHERGGGHKLATADSDSTGWERGQAYTSCSRSWNQSSERGCCWRSLH